MILVELGSTIPTLVYRLWLCFERHGFYSLSSGSWSRFGHRHTPADPHGARNRYV